MKRFLIEAGKAVALIAIATVVTVALSPNVTSLDAVATLLTDQR